MSLEALRKQYAFPASRPDKIPFDWPLDGGGRDLITDIIEQRDIRLMVEVGVFFGSSARRWLEASPRLTLIGVDPWGPFVNYFDRVIDSYERKIDFNGMTRETLRQQLEGENATMECVLSNLWDYRDRFIPMRDKSPAALHVLHDAGVRPEMVYFDADKQGEDLEVCREIFPDATICGDDWMWRPEEGFPVQKIVHAFAERHNLRVVFDRATWAVHPAQ
jgi:hypothetical protein